MPDGRRRAQHHRIVTAPPTAQVDDLIDNAVAAKLATARRAGVVCFVDYKGDKYFFKQPHGITTESRNSFMAPARIQLNCTRGEVTCSGSENCRPTSIFSAHRERAVRGAGARRLPFNSTSHPLI